MGCALLPRLLLRRVWAWGDNSKGQLGFGRPSYTRVPLQIR
ncbi:hypothetical protein JYJ95_22375 [Corallococcus exiguus]|nr:hypothetical protein [Corallococcus exiguus]